MLKIFTILNVFFTKIWNTQKSGDDVCEVTRMDHLKLQLQGYHLTTAEILYHLPDYPDLLQTYVWQEYDQIPGFPILKGFLHYWQRNLDGKLYAVTLASVDDIRASTYVRLDGLLRLH